MEQIIYMTFFILSLLAYITRHVASNGEGGKGSISNDSFKRFAICSILSSNLIFPSFQNSFVRVYFLALFSDWLKGPYVYKLYSHYGFEESQIAVLYLAGFASSVLFGTCTGTLADIWGRRWGVALILDIFYFIFLRRMAFAFTIIYAASALTKLSPNFWWLMTGRILGGVSTSILFSTFESWYVYEHSERHGFPPEWIGITFSLTTFWNGILAIAAGIVSNVLAENLEFGPVAPFLAAVVPLIACGLFIATSWEENYGNRQSHITSSCIEGLTIIFADSKVLLLGIVQV